MIAGGWSLSRRQHFLPKGQGAGGLLSGVIAVMVFLTAIALACALALGQLTHGLSRDLDRKITVQIVEGDPVARAAQSKAVLAILRTDPAIESTRLVAERELRAMLTPWLGDAVMTADLPMPAMIDAMIAPSAPIDVDALQKRIGAVAPSARVDGHASWLGPLAALVQTLQAVAAGMIMLALLAMIAVVALATRSGLSAHGPTIALLHLLGAEDRTLAAIFQQRYAMSALLGGAIGIVLALLALLMVGMAGTGLSQNDAGRFLWLLTPMGWLALLLLPFGAALIAMLTARVTVMRTLAEMP